MLREELKKIWRPGILIAIVFFGVVFYWMFLQFSISYFPNGPYNEELFRIASEMVDTYGTSLEAEAFEEFAATLSELEAEADEYILANAVAQEYGITNYTEYLAFSEEANEITRYSEDKNDPAQIKYAAYRIILNYLTSSETNNIHGRIFATEMYVSEYKYWQANGVDILSRSKLSINTEKEYENAKELFFGTDNTWQNIMPSEIVQTTGTYFSYLLVWMVLSLCILLSPVLVRDRMHKMRPIQWSSRRGRGILKAQSAAVMLSTFALTSINLLIFGSLFLTNGTAVFAECKMFSFMMTTGYSWLNWSYGTWCVVLIVICYLVSIGVSGAVLFLSNYSGNYITMLLKLIPLFVAIAIVSTKLIDYAFYYNNALYMLTNIPMIECAITAIILVVGIMMSVISIVRSKKKDLLTV